MNSFTEGQTKDPADCLGQLWSECFIVVVDVDSTGRTFANKNNPLASLSEKNDQMAMGGCGIVSPRRLSLISKMGLTKKPLKLETFFVWTENGCDVHVSDCVRNMPLNS